jgi:hypothetical protein
VLYPCENHTFTERAHQIDVAGVDGYLVGEAGCQP